MPTPSVTVTSHCALASPDLAVITAEPIPTAVIFPVWSTAAALSLLLSHFTVLSAALSGNTSAFSVTAPSRASVTSVRSRVILTAGILCPSSITWTLISACMPALFKTYFSSSTVPLTVCIPAVCGSYVCGSHVTASSFTVPSSRVTSAVSGRFSPSKEVP